MFSTRLKEVRTSKGITQKQLAAETALTEVAIQNYENNRRKPTYDAIITIADYFDVSLDYLTGRTDKPEVNK